MGVDTMSGESEEYLGCRYCNQAFKIKGDTQKQRDAYMLILLQSFKWEPCSNRIANAVRSGLRQGSQSSHYAHNPTRRGTPPISKAVHVNATFDDVKDAMKKTRLNMR